MQRLHIAVGLIVFTTITFLNSSDAKAAGLLIADGGLGGRLEIKSHDVKVTVSNGIAVTTVTQVFQNLENRQVEALYTFPVPKSASVSNFSMWIAGKEMVGEVVEKKRAREIYDSYKSQQRDPGLLEQVDYRTFEMRIFPIAANAEQRVQVTYCQELAFDHDWATYVYPLATNTRNLADSKVSGTFSIRAEIKSPIPIVSVESPSHRDEFAIATRTENLVDASLEARSGDLQKDVVLAFHTSRPQTGIDLLTSRQGREDGYFSLTMTAGEELPKIDSRMDYVFVLDISGSMEDDGKLELSRKSLGAFIDSLDEESRFEVLAFNVKVEQAFASLKRADAETKAKAKEFLRKQMPRGGTQLNRAMEAAYRYEDPARPMNVVVLSDGLTEQRDRTSLVGLIGKRPKDSRVFCVGVGNDVNRPLLEQIAQESGGLAAFVSRGDDFSRQAEAFGRKLRRPVATNVAIHFAGANVYDVEPKVIPNLYHGSPIRLYGRYKSAGDGELKVSANVLGKAVTQAVNVAWPAEDLTHPEIERMWAQRRVDELLKRADAKGSRTDVIDEIIRLGEGFSILTEYTSFLVLENDSEYRRWNIDRKNALRVEKDRAAQDRVAKQLEKLRESHVVGPMPDEMRKEIAIAPTVNSPAVDASRPSVNVPPAQRTPDGTQRFGFSASGGGAIDWMTGAGVLVISIGFWWKRRLFPSPSRTRPG